MLPVNFSYLKNDGIERLFFDSNKSGTAEVSLLSLKNKRQEFFFAPEPLVFKGSFVFAAQGRLSGNWRLLFWTKFCHKVLEV